MRKDAGMAIIKLHTPTHMQDDATVTEFEADDIRHIVSIVGDDNREGTHFYLKGISEKQFCLEPAREVKQLVASSKQPLQSQPVQHIHIGSIGTFTGNLASNVSAHSLQIGGVSFSAINEQLKAAGISQQERNDLENIMDELKAAKPANKLTIFQRGVAWVDRNKSALGTLAATLLYWLEHHAK